MAAAIALRSNFTGADLRRLARRTQVVQQGRRPLGWPRSTMAAVAVMPHESAMSACRSFGTGCMRFYAEGHRAA